MEVSSGDEVDHFLVVYTLFGAAMYFEEGVGGKTSCCYHCFDFLVGEKLKWRKIKKYL